jgi:vacuolar-type H+-ATPase subunit I/STV1
MQDSTWIRALLELAETVLVTFVRFWKQDMVQVFLAVGMFLALAVPLLIVILVLWYIDSTGWRPTGGFYKIGLSGSSVAFEAKMYAAGLVIFVSDARSVRASH